MAPGCSRTAGANYCAHGLAHFQSINAHDRAQPSSVAPVAYSSRVPNMYELKDLVGVAEIAERLGLGTSIVHDWRRRHSEFPQPVLRLRMGFIWSWTEVAAWAKQSGRLNP
jgi:predicted DNA-binding transcriptional regulator AlpA